jgi:hypothetical protein
MPKFDGVYQDTKGRWYFKVWLGRDPISGSVPWRGGLRGDLRCQSPGVSSATK